MGRFNALELADIPEPPSGGPKDAGKPCYAGEPVKDAQYFLDRGDRLFFRSVYERALEEYSRAVGLDPGSAPAWQGQVFSLIELGEYHEAGLWYANAAGVVGETPDLLALRALAANGVVRTGRWAWCLVIGILIILWIMIGITNLGKVNAFAMTALFILTLILCKVIFFDSGAIGMAADDSMTFGAAVELSVAMPLSWLPLIGDYTREAREPVKATAASAIVYGLVSCWMYVIGMGAAIYTGEYDIAQIMLKAGLGIAGLLIVVFSTVTTTFLDAYSAGISSESIIARWNGKHVAVIVTVIGTIAAIVYPMDNITDFLYLIGSVFAPMIAIQIADFFLLKRDSSKDRANIPNLLVWAVGFAIYRILMHIDMPVGNTLPDMVITILLCLIVSRILKQKK